MQNAGGKPKLFLYSLALPALWFSIGAVLDLLFPGNRPGIPGLVMVLIVATVAMSWLLARKFRRQFTTKERWRLIGYCFVWAFMSESLALFHVISFPEEAGITVDLDTARITVLIIAVLNFLFVWAAINHWSPTFIDWYLKGNGTDAA
jgi:hypothetical protein